MLRRSRLRPDWLARRRRLVRKRARADAPKSGGRLKYRRDRSRARERPAEAVLAFFANFFLPGTGLMVYGQRRWGLIFLAVTIVSIYTLWILTMPFSAGMTANFAFRRED